MSSDISEFLGQPFVSSILSLLCVVLLLLIGTITALVYVRRRRALKKLAESTSPSPSFVTANDYALSSHDMPDLDLLMHTPAVPPAQQIPAPPVQPASAPIVPPPVSAAPAPVRSARKGTFTVMPKDGSSTEAVEVLTILRDVVDGSLIVQMGEKAYHNVNSDAEFKERFGKLMREVGQMVTKPASAAPPTNEIQQPAQPTETEVAPLPSVSDLIQANEPSFLAPKRQAPPPPAGAKLPGDLPSFKLDDNPMQKLKRGQKNDIPPVPELNIAGAIEAYLQHKLSLTSDFAGRNIHINPTPGGGVSITVDGKYFEAVSDVSDPTVREFLSDTISEWQDRH